LTTITLLGPVLTPANLSALLDAARHKSKRHVEILVAGLAPQPDVKPVVRRLPDRTQNVAALERASIPLASLAVPSLLDAAPQDEPTGLPAPSRAAAPRPTMAPIAGDRFLSRVTLSADAHARLRCAQDLMRHSVPNGDAAEIIDRALALLVEHLRRTKLASTPRPRTTSSESQCSSTSRHIPAPVKRAVWSRDGGRCAFHGARGRCTETGWLEYHHVVPFARGGRADVANIALRCRAHNGFEGELEFGPGQGG